VVSSERAESCAVRCGMSEQEPDGYAALAAAQDDEDRAYADALRSRRRDVSEES
jgi:hypothetical protein